MLLNNTPLNSIQKDTLIVVAPAMHNWAETHRMLSFALEFHNRGYPIVVLGDGIYAHLFTKAGFMLHELPGDAKWFTEKRIHKMMNMDTYGNHYTTEDELTEIVEDEAAFLRSVGAGLVITGYRVTLSISCRIAAIPLVWVLSAVVSPMYYLCNYATVPYGRQIGKFNLGESDKKNKLYAKIVLSNSGTSKVWNNVLSKAGLPKLDYDLQIYQGDYNLMSDAPELFDFGNEIKENYDFCGPIFNHEDIEIPDSVKSFCRDGRKTVFLTMGSSGNPEVFLKLIDYLSQLSCQVFVSTSSIISLGMDNVPNTVVLEKKYPPVYMARFADISVIHGGQGTIYSTLLGGKPYIGIPMFNEQQYNLENLKKQGCGCILNKDALQFEDFKTYFIQLMNDEQMQSNLEAIRDKLEKYYSDPTYFAPKVGVDKITRFFDL